MIESIKPVFRYAIALVVMFSHLITTEGMSPQIEDSQNHYVRIGQTYYPGLHQAVADAKTGDTLSLLKSMEINQEIRIEGKNITIQPQGDIILRRGDYDGHLLYIAPGASLTLLTHLLPISSPDPSLAGTDLLDENNRLVINGDWKEIVEDRVVKRPVNGCIIANYGHCVINGNIIVCNNYNLNFPEHEDMSYEQRPNGAVYNCGTFDMLIGYIGWNRGSGVLNANNAIFNMYLGGIFKNFAYHGGGVLNYGTFNMHGGKISTNRAYFHGAGVYNKGNFNILNGTISANETDFSDIQSDVLSSGGGIYNDKTGKLTVRSGMIERNFAKNGGGIYNKGSLTMAGGVIRHNAALAIYYCIHTFVPQDVWIGISEEDVIRGYKIYDISGRALGNGGGIYTISDTHLAKKAKIESNTQTHGNDIFTQKDHQHNIELDMKEYHINIAKQ